MTSADKRSSQRLLTDEGFMAMAWFYAVLVDCPQCEGGSVWIWDTNRARCIHCDYEYDRVNVRGPQVLFGNERGELELAG